MIEFWLVCVGILFVLAEFVLWIKDFILPLPIYILAGAFLAITSNYQGGMMSLFRQPNASPPDAISQTSTTIEERQTLESNNTIQSPLLPAPSTEPKERRAPGR
ncbi:hypothetical protein ACLFKQ_06300 [Myxosarcina sp. GI1(2024)]